tara:strand:+ start:576 stop:3725 length:3150 start_codon:yes stop_codon:yes gene_type:complete
MSSITQRIPNLLAGISQQPDNRKRPGQVKDAVNVYPDFTLGMLKRPGSKFVSNLHGANLTDSAKWFHILRDEQEKYIAQYADNVFRVWSLIDGGVRVVDMGTNTGVPGTCNVATSKTEANALNTALSLVQTRLGTLREKEDALAAATAGQNTTVTKLFSVSNTYTVDVEETLESGILENSSGQYLVKNNGTILTREALSVSVKRNAFNLTNTGSTTNIATTSNGTGTGITVDITFAQIVGTSNYKIDTVSINTNGTGYWDGEELSLDGYPDVTLAVTGVSKGSERTNQYPLIASQGYRIYELQQPVAATHTGQQLTDATTEYNTAKTNYDAAVADVETATTGKRAVYDSAVADCAITTVPTNAYLKDATADDLEFLTLNDYTFVLNKAKTVSMTTDTSAAQVNEGFVYINSVSPSTDYEIRLTYSGTTRTFTFQTSNSGHIDANTICVGLIAELADTANYSGSAAEYTGVEVGSGIYITRTDSEEFDIETRGGSSDNAIYGFTDTVPNTSFLPIQAKNGYKVKVVNTTDVEIDDMWVEFQASHNATYGGGAWIEITAPGLKYKLDPLTMPHQLVRQADGSFKYEPVTWIDRLVGDDNTNPLPTFVGQKISNLFFYRNRLGFLSNGNVIMSKAADYFNFFNTSAQVATDDDPIDISAVGTRPAFLKYALPTAVGLVVYGSSEQHILSTDSDLFSPKTVKISTLSSYETDEKIEPVSVGTSQAFVSKTPLYTRLFELLDINRDRPPLMNDDTVVVPELVPASVDSMAASSALSLISLNTKGTNDLYQFRFLSAARDKRQLSTWYKWKTTTKVLHQFFDANTFYVIGNTDSEGVIESYDMSQSSEEGFLTIPTGEKTDVCLDLFYVNPHRTYDSNAKETTVELPYVSTGGTLAAVILGPSNGAVLYPTVTNDTFVLDGDYRGTDIVIGYNYDMELTLPKLYVYQQDGESVRNDPESNLILHRLRVQTGLSGPVDYEIKIDGLNDYTHTASVTMPYEYEIGEVNMQANATHVVPIHQRNNNLNITIKGTTPFPVSLLGFDWEGKYNSRFYRRI